jgi:excisionase family DNA binding protein
MATPSEILAKPVMTVLEIHELTSLSRGELYEMVKDGRLEGVKVGRRVLVRTDSVQRLLGLPVQSPQV